VKSTQAFTDCGAAKNTVLGSADCILCDAAKVFDVTRHVLAPEPECLVTRERIEKERWADYILYSGWVTSSTRQQLVLSRSFLPVHANHFFMSAADSVERDKLLRTRHIPFGS
jgi:hypothetical protein